MILLSLIVIIKRLDELEITLDVNIFNSMGGVLHQILYPRLMI